MTTSRRKRMTRLSGLIDGMVAPSVQKRGFVMSRLVSEWPMIAGDMARWSRPSQMNLSRSGSGTLKLAIASGFGPVALQMKTAIIDRVNAAFGFRAVSEVVFVQTLPPPRNEAPSGAGPVVSEEQRTKATWALDAKLEKVKSPELRAALRRLGSAD
ncbi:MAG: DciA family protein [Pseudomonadota bacterium]|nr:DciA family protein [Pseudomonadota bacterium]